MELTDLIQLSTGALGLRALVNVTAKTVADQPDMLDMRASDATLDRDREVIDAAGWKLDNYRKNPVIQNAHNYGNIIHTIGRAISTEVRDGALVQRWEFASAANPIAKIAASLYRGGFLKAASVGFSPVKWEMGDGSPAAQYRRRYTEQELLEVSAVGVPANPNALALGLKSGALEKADLVEALKILKHFCSTDGNAADAGDTGRASELSQLLKQAKALSDVLRKA